MKKAKTCFLLLFVLFSALLCCPARAKVIDGTVLAVNEEHNFVIIDMGKQDGIRKNMVLMVYRERKLLGKVEVEEVFEDMSSCVILPWFEKVDVKINDGVLAP